MKHIRLQARLSLFDAFAVVAGTTIGSGIFIVSAGIARDVKSPALLLLVWLAASAMSVTGALTIAELAAMMPSAGAQYVFLREAYGRMCSFLFGWTVVLVIHTGSVAAVAIVFAKYLGVILPAINSQLRFGFVMLPGERFVAIALIAFLTAANACGIHAGRALQNLFTVAKIAALLTVIAFALVIAPNPTALHANFGDWKAFVGSGGVSFALLPAFGAAMIGALFSLGGSDNLIALAAEVRNPGRSLPIALISSAGIVVVLYLLTNLAYLAQLPLLGDPDAATAMARGISGAHAGRVAAAAMEVMWGSAGARFTGVLVIISTIGCLNGLILGGARLMFAMARDRVFFSGASRLNRVSVPAIAMGFQALWASALAVSGDFSDLLNYMGAAGAFFGILGIGAVFVLRIKKPDARRPYRAWGYPYVPAAHIAGSVAILIDLILVKPKYSLFGLLIVLSGVPLYLWLQRRKRLAGTSVPEFLVLGSEPEVDVAG